MVEFRNGSVLLCRHKFYLIFLGQPILWNKEDTATLKVMFEATKKRCPEVAIKYLMTDDGTFYIIIMCNL